MKRGIALGLATSVLLAAAPASAQYYSYPYDRDGDVVREVVNGVAAVAGAVNAATQGYGYGYPGYGYPNSGYGYGYPNSGYGYPNAGYGYGYNYGGGVERIAADACAYEAQRRLGRRYGPVGVNIHGVRWSRRDRMNVMGAADVRGGYNRYDRYGNGRIAFTCSVRPDGRVRDFDTHNYRW